MLPMLVFFLILINIILTPAWFVIIGMEYQSFSVGLGCFLFELIVFAALVKGFDKEMSPNNAKIRTNKSSAFQAMFKTVEDWK